RALLKNDIPVDIIAGSSIGAVVGAMYAATLDIDWVEERFRQMLLSEEFADSGIKRVEAQVQGDEPGFLEWATHYMRNKLVLSFSDRRIGVVKTERIARLIDFMLPVKTFTELRLPFACAAVDLESGRDVVLDSGNLVDAVVASTSIPGYLPPVPTEQGLLTDGAVGQPIPGELAGKLGAEFIIAVDISIDQFLPLEKRNIVTILGRASEIAATRFYQAQGRRWDCLLSPDVGNTHWTRFDLIDELIAAGEQAVQQEIDILRRNLRQARSVRTWLGRRLGLVGPR
ncbi:MAG: patatin-like phospholipase family protein, partial [Candidatus Neomarinimicrobiota bacterium]